MPPASKVLMTSVSGIRGVVGAGLDAEVACGMAAAFGTWAPSGPIVVGRDSRLTGPMLLHAVSAGLVSTGHDVIDIGIATTPRRRSWSPRMVPPAASSSPPATIQSRGMR